MLYLASQSPQRSALLKSVSVEFSVFTSSFDESSLHYLNLPPVVFAEETAQAKLEYVLQNEADRLTSSDTIITADTVVFLNNKTMYGKPKNVTEAMNMLRSLSGKAHRVVTAIAGYNVKNKKKQLVTDISKVWFNRLSDDDIALLINTNEWAEAAGAYRIQGKASFFIKKIAGSYSGIEGFPFASFYQLMKKLKAKITYLDGQAV